MMKRQEGENAGVLRRWCLIPNIDPVLMNNYKMTDWNYYQRLFLRDQFEFPLSSQYVYLELLYICDRRNELKEIMMETELYDLALEVFTML